MAGAEFRRIAAGLKSLPRQWCEAGAATVRDEVDTQIGRDTGGDRQLSGAPGRIGITVRVVGDAVVKATIQPAKRGIARLTWLEDGTAPHLNGGNRPGTEHPGTAAKGTWTRPTSRALAAVARDAGRRFDDVMRR